MTSIDKIPDGWFNNTELWKSGIFLWVEFLFVWGFSCVD
jgi:hypothetical protein